MWRPLQPIDACHNNDICVGLSLRNKLRRMTYQLAAEETAKLRVNCHHSNAPVQVPSLVVCPAQFSVFSVARMYLSIRQRCPLDAILVDATALLSMRRDSCSTPQITERSGRARHFGKKVNVHRCENTGKKTHGLFANTPPSV